VADNDGQRARRPEPGKLSAVNTLAWTGAIGGVIAAIAGIVAAIGAWRTEITARWQERAERQRTDEARTETSLHRQRFTEVWDWWHGQPDGPERAAASRWYSEWAGAREPFHATDPGPQPPGTGSPSADDAYERYLDHLTIRYTPAWSTPGTGRRTAFFRQFRNPRAPQAR
jgi:hypothetical protein